MIIPEPQYNSFEKKSRFFEKIIEVKDTMSVYPPEYLLERDQIFLAEYKPSWPLQAEQEIEKIKSLLPYSWCNNIQHMGSTAIPGMCAKPVIDLIMTVMDFDEARKCLPPLLEKLDYLFWADNPKKYHLFFVKGLPPYGKGRTHHFHVYGENSFEAISKLLFRDYLRENPETARAYKHLKQELAVRFREDREIYTRSKDDFIETINLKAFQKIIDFIPLQESHFSLLYQWLNLSNQLKWYGNGKKVFREAIEEKYSSYCRGFKEEKGQKKSIHAFIITWNGHPIGFIQFYDAYDFKRDFGEIPSQLVVFQDKLAALDFYVAESDYLGRGLVPMILRQFLKRHVWLNFSACFVDPDIHNHRAIKAYKKAGFEKIMKIKSEVCVLMLARKRI